MKKLLLILFCLPFFGWGQFSVGNDQTICLGDQATVIGITSIQASIDSYEVIDITYSPETITGTPISLFLDDVQGPFPLGFTFQFYGNDYTEFYVGSNGWIGFTAGQPTSYIASPIPDATSFGVPKDCIMLSWQDLDATSGGQVLYQTIGTTPNRKLVLTFDNIPYFGFGVTSGPVSLQIVLYEGSNVIDNHTIDKPVHTVASVQGIHNLLGTSATVVPGRNYTVWDANQESVRYFPSGISWYDVSTGQMVGNGDTLLYAPNQSTYIRAEIIDGTTGIMHKDSMYIQVLDPNISSTGLSLCNGDIDLTAPIAFSTYIWNNQSTNSLLTVNTAGTYYVNSTTSNGLTCQSDPITIYSGNISIALSTPDSVFICQGDIVTIDGPAGFSQYNWSTSETTSSITSTLTGNYSLSVVDANGCTGTSNITSISIFPSIITANTTGLSLCNGPVTLNAGSGFASYEWYGNGSMTSTTESLIVTNPGYYHVEVIYPTGCTAASDTLTIIDGTSDFSVPIDSIGDGALCLPNGQVILDAGGPYATYSWNSGDTTQQISVNTEGHYTVEVTDANGCEGASDSAFVVSNIVNTSDISGPLSPSIFQSVTYSVNPTVGSTYTWTLIGGTITGQGTNSIDVIWNFIGTFSFSVIETDVNGCIGEEVLSPLIDVVSISSVEEKNTNNRKLTKITDILGRGIKQKINTPFIKIYDDGTVEKRIIME